MKKLLLILLIILPVYFLTSLYFLDKDYFLCPIQYKTGIFVRCDTRGDGLFGSSRNGSRVHEGLDLLARIGEPVKACRAGKVIVSREQKNGMGKYIIIRHTGNLATLYGHLSRIYVAKNDFVRQGQVIGEAGKTGNANNREIQPHLHFEVRKNGLAQDPLEYLQ